MSNPTDNTQVHTPGDEVWWYVRRLLVRHCNMSKIAEFKLSRFIKAHVDELLNAVDAGGGVLEVSSDGSIVTRKQES